MKIRHLVDLATDRPAYVAGVGAFALVVLLLGWRTARRALAGRRPENVLTVVAAGIATAVAGTGMWRFFGVTLHFSGPLRVLLFAFLEIAVFASALRARRNVAESITHSAGIDGAAVWALTALSAVLSSLDARSFAEAVFRLAAPMVAAWLWERSMSVERRRARGRGIHWRITPERVLVRLGLAEAADRTASEVDAHRRLTRVALAAQRLRTLRATAGREWRRRWAERRLDATMRAAIEHTAITEDEDSQEALLGRIGALFHARALAEMEPDAPWGPPAPVRPPLRLFRVGDPTSVIDWDRLDAELDGDPFTDTPPVIARWLDDGGKDVPDPREAVPDVPPAPDPEQVRAAQAFAGDICDRKVPSIREIKKRMQVAQDKAKEVQAYLAVLANQ